MSLLKPNVAISGCLLGDNVRYNGGHKQNKLCKDNLGQHFNFVRVCPEVDIGLGVPRPPIRLIQTKERIKAVETDNPNIDHSTALSERATTFLRKNPSLSGFIATGGSPSCGVFSSKVYSEKGHPIAKHAGLFSAALMRANPLLPVEEQGRLNDAGLRESFVTRVYAYQRWQQLNTTELTSRGLVEFHSKHKYLVMCHSNRAYKTLGQLIAKVGISDLEQTAQQYIGLLMHTLTLVPRRGQQCNVLHHLLGHLKGDITSDERHELIASFESFRSGVVPLIVPLTLLRHHFEKHKEHQNYPLQQIYLAPHPDQMGLRSHIH